MSLQIHISPFRLSHQMKNTGGKQNYRHLFSALQHGADAVMTAHIIVPALDDSK